MSSMDPIWASLSGLTHCWKGTIAGVTETPPTNVLKHKSGLMRITHLCLSTRQNYADIA